MANGLLKEADAIRNYTFGINVLTADELADMAPQIKAFIAEVGDGQAEIQVAINPNGIGMEDAEVLAPAIGFAVMQAEDYEMEDDEYDEE